MTPWTQIYNPFGSILLSALIAALPVATMLVGAGLPARRGPCGGDRGAGGGAGGRGLRLRHAGGIAGTAAGLGIASGLFPIGWIVLNIIFLYRLTVANGSFDGCRRRSPASPPTAACSCC